MPSLARGCQVPRELPPSGLASASASASEFPLGLFPHCCKFIGGRITSLKSRSLKDFLG